MEGPSLVIATEEFAPYLNRPILEADGTARLDFKLFQKSKLRAARSWGKHLILVFDSFALRIHFLMFGSYRIGNPRKNRVPKLRLVFDKQEFFFYSCAIKLINLGFEEKYDWSIDLMAPEWKSAKAVRAVAARPQAQVCDLLMDQDIFAGLGNIMKNEILFNVRKHPEARVEQLTKSEIVSLVREARAYAKQFYKWKKENVLKKNWQVFRNRKKVCPACERKIKKRPTGKLQRVSHYCSHCQPKSA